MIMNIRYRWTMVSTAAMVCICCLGGCSQKAATTAPPPAPVVSDIQNNQNIPPEARAAVAHNLQSPTIK